MSAGFDPETGLSPRLRLAREQRQWSVRELARHASGPRSGVIYGSDDLYPWATLWLRDDRGPWHATRLLARSGMSGEVALRVEVVPPLSLATTWIELLTAGPAAEVRVTVPLHWAPIGTR